MNDYNISPKNVEPASKRGIFGWKWEFFSTKWGRENEK